MIDNYVNPKKGEKFVVDAWIVFQLPSLEPLSPSLWDGLLLFLAFASQTAPGSSCPESRRRASWRTTFSGGWPPTWLWGSAPSNDPPDYFPKQLVSSHYPSRGSWQEAVRTKRCTTEHCQVEDQQIPLSSKYNPSLGLGRLLSSLGSAHWAKLSPWPAGLLHDSWKWICIFHKTLQEHPEHS